jgi:TatD DNase family protein
LTPSDLDEENFIRTKKLVRENRGRVVGLGEVGLDYYWVKEESGWLVEKRNFIEFIGLAKGLGMPLVVHSRAAESACINILEEHKTSAIMHCFSGTIEEAKRAVGFGCLISIPTNVTYVGKRQKLVKALPLTSIVLETDAPYLAPVKGERNEPANVKAAVEKVAELKGLDASEVEDVTTENALNYFKLKNG